MLREGKNKIPSGWPTVSSTTKPAARVSQCSDRAAYNGDGDSDEYSAVPEYKETFSSALAAAFDQAAANSFGMLLETNLLSLLDVNSILLLFTGTEKQEGGQSKGKKKKSKQKILFSTGMNFM